MIDAMGKALQEKMAGYQEEMLFHFKELLKIDSVRGERQPGAPFGLGNRKALDYVLALSESFGLKTVNLDYFIGYSEYGQGEEYICSVAHLDVVPPGDGWKHPPFGAQVEDGVLYARGAGDDKPGVIAGLYTLRCMKELGWEPERRVRVIYGCAEETGMEDMDHYLESQPLPAFGFTPDSDGYDIVNAEKGRMEIALEAPLGADSPWISVTGGLASNMVPGAVTAVLDRSRLTLAEGERLEKALAGPLLSTLGLATVFVCMMLVCNSVLQAYGFVNLPILVMVVGGGMKIFTNYHVVAMPKVGIYGAPLGNILCFGLCLGLDLVLIARVIPRRPRYLDIFLKPFLASALMGGSAWAVYGLGSKIALTLGKKSLDAALASGKDPGGLGAKLCDISVGLQRVLDLSRTGNALITLGAIGIAVIVYGVLVVALRAISRDDLALMPKGDKIAKLLRL